MHTIDLDASRWTKLQDFYDALLLAVGAPPWHGTGINAFVDSMIYGGINSLEPPYTIRIHHLRESPKDVLDEVELTKNYLGEHRAHFRAQYGRDVEVRLEILS